MTRIMKLIWGSHIHNMLFEAMSIEYITKEKLTKEKWRGIRKESLETIIF